MLIVDESVLDRFRGPGRCGYCRKQVKRLEPHHHIPRGIGGGSRIDHPYNLIGLCGTFSGGDDCHRRVTDGEIDGSEILALIAAREGVLQDHIMATLYEILRAPK